MNAYAGTAFKVSKIKSSSSFWSIFCRSQTLIDELAPPETMLSIEIVNQKLKALINQRYRSYS